MEEKSLQNQEGMQDITEVQSVGNALATTPQEYDIQISTAKRYPRDIVKVMAEAESMATRTLKIAQNCFYTLPRAGKDIEGPSIRLAEIFMSSWGNFKAGAESLKPD